MKPILILIISLMVAVTTGQTVAYAGGDITDSISIKHVGEDFFKEIENLKNRIEQFLDILSDIPDSEEFKALEKEINRLAEEINRSGNSVKEQMQNDVLPQLEKTLERLRDRLRRLDRKKEIRPRKIESKKLYAT